MKKLANISVFESLGSSTSIICDMSCFNAVATTTALADSEGPENRPHCSVSSLRNTIKEIDAALKLLHRIVRANAGSEAGKQLSSIYKNINSSVNEVITGYEKEIDAVYKAASEK